MKKKIRNILDKVWTAVKRLPAKIQTKKDSFQELFYFAFVLLALSLPIFGILNNFSFDSVVFFLFCSIFLIGQLLIIPPILSSFKRFKRLVRYPDQNDHDFHYCNPFQNHDDAPTPRYGIAWWDWYEKQDKGRGADDFHWEMPYVQWIIEQIEWEKVWEKERKEKQRLKEERAKRPKKHSGWWKFHEQHTEEDDS